MKITHEQYDRVAVISLSGELNADETEPFQQLITQCLESDTRDFVLDLSEMDMIDSQGLESMLWIQEQTDERLGQIRLAGPTENIQSILHVTRLEHHFDQHADVETALKSLR